MINNRSDYLWNLTFCMIGYEGCLLTINTIGIMNTIELRNTVSKQFCENSNQLVTRVIKDMK
jgi:hypothetical protein